ncbi:MAG: hypothetical protein ACTSRU_16600 [Candidatus Hodarchaeales archaeon]
MEQVYLNVFCISHDEGPCPVIMDEYIGSYEVSSKIREGLTDGDYPIEEFGTGWDMESYYLSLDTLRHLFEKKLSSISHGWDRHDNILREIESWTDEGEVHIWLVVR